LHNIGQAHVTPAHGNLKQVSPGASPAESNVKPVDEASFHIGRAREMLADLTRTFEQVKREQKIADAMQKLAKMHQIFIEDTQALLGNSKGPINSYDRKIAEVNDEYVEKLRALLEEKKKVLAELSKLLSEDPRLLRRFLAMQQLQCASYRDQMTLLAERQKQMQKQVAAWNSTPRPTGLLCFRNSGRTMRLVSAKSSRTPRPFVRTWRPGCRWM
jgi:galactokinase